MFSAKKVKGQKLYVLARKGIEIERKPILVQMQVALVDYCYPHLKLKVICSKGTYIRSIAQDLGQKLQTQAHLIELTGESFGVDAKAWRSWHRAQRVEAPEQ